MILRNYILTMGCNEIGFGDVLKAYWDDSEGLELIAKLHRGSERKEARKELRQRRARIHLAFNQLFLMGKAKMVLPNTMMLGTKSVTFAELKEQAIERCEKSIEESKRMIKEGTNDIMTRCWLENLEDYLESYKNTEVIRRSQLNRTIRHVYRAKGALICVGSQLAMGVWPTRIALIQAAF